MLISDILLKAVETGPERRAVWENQRWYSYGEICTRAQSVATRLLECGAQRGERIALLMENSADWIASYFGILFAGCVVVGCNTELKDSGLEHLLDDSDAVGLITNHRYRAKYSSFSGFIQLVEDIGVPDDRRLDLRGMEHDLAEIVYTSGSTGAAKGVMLSHGNLLSNTASIVSYLGLNAQDRIMVILPFFYIYGKSLLLTHFSVGGAVVIDNRFVYPNLILNTMIETEVSGFAGVPSTFSILQYRSKVRDMEFPSLRYLTQAGGGMAPDLTREIMHIFSDKELYIMYGATEASPRLTYLPPEMLEEKLGSIGRAIPGVEVRLVDENDREVPPGIEGELIARGSNIMQGYWKDPESTEQVLKNGWYYSGDLGKTDNDGYIYITGRKKDFLKIKGHRVSCREIEEELLAIEGVLEAAVMGKAHKLNGETPFAFVHCQSGSCLTSLDISSALQRRLASYKIPSMIRFVDRIPRTASGKIDKVTLRTWIE